MKFITMLFVHSLRKGFNPLRSTTAFVSSPNNLMAPPSLLRLSSSVTATTTEKSEPSSSDNMVLNDLQQEIDDANARYAGRVEIVTINDSIGYGIVALTDFAKGDLVLESRALAVLDGPNSHSVQLDWGRHVKIDLPSRFVNHRCHTANLGIQDSSNKEHQAFDFYAMRDIAAGEELTWDYTDSEYDMETPFDCTCSDANCRQRVRGWKYITAATDGTTTTPVYWPKYRQIFIAKAAAVEEDDEVRLTVS